LLRTYDYGVSKNYIASHNANWNTSSKDPSSTPFNSDQTIEDYIKAGIPADKIVIGMPLFGRSFDDTDGPGSSFSGVGKGTWEPGVYDYKELPLPGAEVETDHAIGASWSYDSSQRVMISFDTPSTTVTKTKYIKMRGLGGAMWWESSGDKMGNDSLISSVGPKICASTSRAHSLQFVQEVGGIKALDPSCNLLDYPASIYQNMKAGMPKE
jgi:chitinase